MHQISRLFASLAKVKTTVEVVRDVFLVKLFWREIELETIALTPLTFVDNSCLLLFSEWVLIAQRISGRGFPLETEQEKDTLLSARTTGFLGNNRMSVGAWGTTSKYCWRGTLSFSSSIQR